MSVTTFPKPIELDVKWARWGRQKNEIAVRIRQKTDTPLSVNVNALCFVRRIPKASEEPEDLEKLTHLGTTPVKCYHQGQGQYGAVKLTEVIYTSDQLIQDWSVSVHPDDESFDLMYGGNTVYLQLTFFGSEKRTLFRPVPRFVVDLSDGESAHKETFLSASPIDEFFNSVVAPKRQLLMLDAITRRDGLAGLKETRNSYHQFAALMKNSAQFFKFTQTLPNTPSNRRLYHDKFMEEYKVFAGDAMDFARRVNAARSESNEFDAHGYFYADYLKEFCDDLASSLTSAIRKNAPRIYFITGKSLDEDGKVRESSMRNRVATELRGLYSTKLNEGTLTLQ